MTTYEAVVPLVGDLTDEALDAIRGVAGVSLLITFSDVTDLYDLAETVGDLNRELGSMGLGIEVPKPVKVSE